MSAFLLVAALPQDGTAARPATADAAKKTCRREETTGSMFAKRICHTHAEWDAIDAVRRKAAEDGMNSRGPVRPQ